MLGVEAVVAVVVAPSSGSGGSREVAGAISSVFWSSISTYKLLSKYAELSTA